MRKALLSVLAVAAVVATAIAIPAVGANKPVTVEAGNVRFTFNGGFNPSKLPKKKLAPIKLTAAGKIATKDGSHPPAVKEVVLETDKNGAIDVKGVPVCK